MNIVGVGAAKHLADRPEAFGPLLWRHFASNSVTVSQPHPVRLQSASKPPANFLT